MSSSTQTKGVMEMKKVEKRNKLSAAFKEFWGVTEDEEEFFNYLYKKERRYRITIAILIFAILALLLLK